jgi:hypothetical protein
MVVAKSNASKTPRFESWPNPIKVQQISMVGIFHFSPTLHIFSTRRFRLKSPTTLASRIVFKVTKFQLLGAYMVATPSSHLALPV